MSNKWHIVLFTILMAGLTACSEQASSEKNAAEKAHFLSEKQKTIKKAKAVEKMIQDAATQQRRNIEDQGG
ncbi:MAG TPA: hypothetical protein ENK04_05410 [Gammaproteobacteria bacterium]|nr:hypothetical protein [Gammaproteobacteria bacterium]